MQVTKFISSAFTALIMTAMLASCASAVDKTEVEQKSNPVKDMHKEIVKAQEAEKNKQTGTAMRWDKARKGRQVRHDRSTPRGANGARSSTRKPTRTPR
jgi:hypothetical protein